MTTFVVNQQVAVAVQFKKRAVVFDLFSMAVSYCSKRQIDLSRTHIAFHPLM